MKETKLMLFFPAAAVEIDKLEPELEKLWPEVASTFLITFTSERKE